MNRLYRIMIKVRSTIWVFLTHQLALPLLKITRQPEVFPYREDQLPQMPDGMLGKDLITRELKKLINH